MRLNASVHQTARVYRQLTEMSLQRYANVQAPCTPGNKDKGFVLGDVDLVAGFVAELYRELATNWSVWKTAEFVQRERCDSRARALSLSVAPNEPLGHACARRNATNESATPRNARRVVVDACDWPRETPWEENEGRAAAAVP